VLSPYLQQSQRGRSYKPRGSAADLSG